MQDSGDLWQLQLAMMQHRGRLIYRGFRRNFCEHVPSSSIEPWLAKASGTLCRLRKTKTHSRHSKLEYCHVLPCLAFVDLIEERLVSFKDGKPVACGMVGVKTDVAFRWWPYRSQFRKHAAWVLMSSDMWQGHPARTCFYSSK